MKTPLHTLKSEVGAAFGAALWEACARRWWGEYLDGLSSERLSEAAEARARQRAAEKLFCEEWVYLLVTDGFFEHDDLDADSATRAAVVFMRMRKPMAKTHMHELSETRERGASFTDLPHPAARSAGEEGRLDSANCWSSKRPGRFRPLRTADARRHPGWAAAGRHAARLLFACPRSDVVASRAAYDRFRAFCAAMGESLEEAGEDTAPLLRLLHQELSAAPGVCDAYDAGLYETLLTAYLIAAVHGAAAVYDYGLVQRRSPATQVLQGASSGHDAAFEADSVRTSRFAASVYLVDSVTLAPLSLVRTAELNPAFSYLAGRAPSVLEGEQARRARLLLLPGGDAVSRHAFTLSYDATAGAWRAHGAPAASNPWYAGDFRACSMGDFSRFGAGDEVVLRAGSRIVLPRFSMEEGLAVSLPSVMVSLSYRYDLLDDGRWSRWAQVEEFLSVGAVDLWLDAFSGERRALYVPEEESVIAEQWRERGRDGRALALWSGYLEASRAFLAEAAALEPEARLGAACGLREGYGRIERTARRIVRALSKADSHDEATERVRNAAVSVQAEVAFARKRDKRDVLAVERNIVFERGKGGRS